ncbi:MAG TPA: secondary thiamine-phosphate synthase enzyme YjbQ [Steroidobacteraceae bacterium]|nr:secondary thiamine-phosphate synthase enzyme YjbQ [Steroidobacteraceae bacterium]
MTTRGRGFHALTERIERAVTDSGLTIGLCHLFLRHTSASLCVTENADPDVRADLERFAGRTVPDGDPLFVHDAEGPDDMSAHVRTLLVGHELTVPIAGGRLALGTWQGIYLWEHRTAAMQREVLVTLHGDSLAASL